MERKYILCNRQIMNYYVIYRKLMLITLQFFLKCVLSGTVELLDQPLPKIHTTFRLFIYVGQ